MDLRQKTSQLEYSEEDVIAVLGKHNKSLEMAKEDVRVIQDWMKNQKHFPILLPERQIAYFLILQEFDLERTKNALNMYFTMKTVIPEYFTHGPKDQMLIKQMSNYNFSPLPKLSPNLNRIMVSQAKETDFFQADLYMNVLLLLLEATSLADVSNGVEYIIDFRNASEELLDALDEVQIKKLYLIIEKVYFDRLDAIHVLVSPKTGKFMDGFRGNIKPKIQKKLMAHESYEELYEYYTKDLLPKDYGGNLKSVQEYNDDWMKYLQDNNDMLEKFIKARSNENLRDSEQIDPDVVRYDQIHGKHLMV